MRLVGDCPEAVTIVVGSIASIYRRAHRDNCLPEEGKRATILAMVALGSRVLRGTGSGRGLSLAFHIEDCRLYMTR